MQIKPFLSLNVRTLPSYFLLLTGKKTASLPALTGHDNGENGIGGTKSPYFLHRRILEERINDSKNFACVFRVS